MIRETSIEAFRQIEAEGKLSERRFEVYKILFHHGPLTTMEAFQFAKLHGNPNYRHNTHARMNELRERGVVKEVGTKICDVTKRRVILWDVTGNLPQEPERDSIDSVADAIRVAEKWLRRDRNQIPRKAVEVLVKTGKLYEARRGGK